RTARSRDPEGAAKGRRGYHAGGGGPCTGAVPCRPHDVARKPVEPRITDRAPASALRASDRDRGDDGAPVEPDRGATEGSLPQAVFFKADRRGSRPRRHAGALRSNPGFTDGDEPGSAQTRRLTTRGGGPCSPCPSSAVMSLRSGASVSACGHLWQMTTKSGRRSGAAAARSWSLGSRIGGPTSSPAARGDGGCAATG